MKIFLPFQSVLQEEVLAFEVLCLYRFIPVDASPVPPKWSKLAVLIGALCLPLHLCKGSGQSIVIEKDQVSHSSS